MQTLQPDEQLISYLLGELPEGQREELEELFCHDADLFERMLALRDDLTDNYLHGELAAPRLQRFERYFMATPRQREGVKNAKARIQAVAGDPAARMSIFARIKAELVSFWRRLRDLLRDNPVEMWLAVAAALLVFATGGWLIGERMRLRNQLTQAQQHQQEMQQQIADQRARADRAEELASARRPDRFPPPETTPPPRPEEDVIASLILSSDYDQGTKGSGGSGGLQMVVITSERGLLQLRLKLTDAVYRSYRVTLSEVSSGKTVQTLTGLRAQPTGSGNAVIAIFPASSFSGAAKDYLVVLDGRTTDGKYETEIDKYSFRAERK